MPIHLQSSNGRRLRTWRPPTPETTHGVLGRFNL